MIDGALGQRTIVHFIDKCGAQVQTLIFGAQKTIRDRPNVQPLIGHSYFVDSQRRNDLATT